MNSPAAVPIELHGRPAVELATAAGARAQIALHGAQVLSWSAPDGAERLFVGERARFDGSMPIRGGVPVCWPQFAARGRLPRHGLVRQRPWTVNALRATNEYALVSLTTTDDEGTWAQWPHAFMLELTVLIEENRLSLELEVNNTGHASFAFTGALHTYLRVAEVEEARLEGLGGIDFRDGTRHDAVRREQGEYLTVDGEVDRVYPGVAHPLLLRDGRRSLGIHAEGFPDVVVWNPGEARCAEIPDLAPSDFRHMLCVEAALARQPQELAAGETWFGRQTLLALA